MPQLPEWIEEWQNKRGSQRKELKSRLKSLKRQNPKNLARVAGEAHEHVFEKYSCLDCANCCKSIPPIVRPADARRISRFLGMKERDFTDQYLGTDDDGDQVMNTSPCPFLQDDNTCSIYDVRPRACREYPHTDGDEFVKHLKLHQQNVRYCPAVFHIIEEIAALT